MSAPIPEEPPGKPLQPDQRPQSTPFPVSKMISAEAARILVLGEASMLTTAVLKVHHAHHNYYHGGRIGGGLKSSQSMPSRLAAAAASENEEDEEDFFVDSTFGTDRAGDSATSDPSLIETILKNLIRLKGKLRKSNRRNYNVLTDPTYLRPFCEVITSRNTSGPITGMALQSILEFIDNGLVANTESLGSVVAIGESVTKARFVGTDTSSDEVVLSQIVDVLRELVVRDFRSPSNDLIKEIIQSCFRIAFETRLSELLRRKAEKALIDICRSLFARVHLFADTITPDNNQIKMDSTIKISKKLYRSQSEKAPTPATTPTSEANPVLVNSQGVKFAENVPTPPAETVPNKNSTAPHDLTCVYGLLANLAKMTNPYDAQNTDAMINIGLKLLIVAFQSAAAAIGEKTHLMKKVKKKLCWNLTMVSCKLVAEPV